MYGSQMPICLTSQQPQVNGLPINYDPVVTKVLVIINPHNQSQSICAPRRTGMVGMGGGEGAWGKAFPQLVIDVVK